MGKKRKRAQTKQNWSSTNSRKQKKRRKTRGYGFNQAKVPKEVDGSRVKLSNTTDDCNMFELTPLEKSSSFSSVCNFNYTSWINVRLCGISAIFSRLNTCARMLQRPTVECFRSIRNVFLLLNWLKQIFGCGLETLGKFLLAEKDHVTSTDRTTHFEEMMKRMENLEEEVKSLKSELVKKPTCSCGDHSTGSATQGGNVQPSLPLKIQPPPPPPPPPVLPPAAPPLAFLKNKQTRSKATDSKENKNKPSRTLVTVEDLKKVKLRKVEQVIEKDKENTAPESETTSFKLQPREPSLNKLNQRTDVQCVVSLREIKNVTLKRTKRETEMEKIQLRTPEEMVVMRRNLRKVNITRSPGGTPLLSGKSCEHGTGLTPMMTRALRRKFQHAHPYSSPESPTGNRKRQSLSPLAVSPNTPSPLLIRY